MTCRHLKDYAGARLHLSGARRIYETLGDSCRQEQVQCDRHLARVEEDNGNNQAALVAYQELIRVTEREGLVTQHAWCTYYLAHHYNRMNRHEEALSLLKDAIKISREIHDPEIEAFATEDNGYAAERQGHPQLAMDCYEQALGLFKTCGQGKWVGNETRVKKRMDQLRSGFPSLLSTRARSRRWSLDKFVIGSLSR